MITSQVLLTVFVIQWLQSQYKEEKNLLEKELTVYYIESQDEILDTLLFNTYVNPVLSENRKTEGDQTLLHTDSLHYKTLHISNLHDKNNVLKWNDKAVITVNVNRNDSLRNNIRVRKQGLQDEMILKSVKLIVTHSEDMSGNKDSLLHDFSSSMDTAKFKKYFYGRLKGTDMKFIINWKDSTKNTIQQPREKTITINPFTGFTLPEAIIDGYQAYLIRKISPQIIFGIVLVLITALSFFVAYRSIRNHIIMDSLRNEFINNITHELKTPVSTIMIALESLGNFKMRNEPHKIEEYLNLASLETKRLEELINRVLDQTLLEHKGLPLNIVSVHLEEMIREIAEIMSKKLGDRGIIEFIPSDSDVVIQADALYLKGVLINIIDNSIKYCDKEPVISIHLRTENSQVIIEVQDNGPGIPEEYHKRIFEKFFRLPSDNIHNIKGYGLGLSFAHQVMELHNGSIEVKNNNPGCSFVLKFPRK